MKDFIGHTSCPKCGKMFEIRVPNELQASLVIQMLAEDYGGKCKDCIGKEKQQQEEVE